MEKNQLSSPYWKWVPAAFALAGIILFVFTTFGPPASSSGFVAALKGAIEPVAPAYVDGREHYRMSAGPGAWVFAFVLGMAHRRIYCSPHIPLPRGLTRGRSPGTNFFIFIPATMPGAPC